MRSNEFDSLLLATLQEVAPPLAVKQIREKLNKYHPNIKVDTSIEDVVIEKEDFELVLKVFDWPMINDPQLGIGPHVAVQLDDLPLRRLTEVENGELHVLFKNLSPGSHRVSAYAAYPWGEAVNAFDSKIQLKVHIFEKLDGTQPNENQPWLNVVSPNNSWQSEPVLIDWILWNSPIQEIKENDSFWKLKITINGESFVMNQQEPIWVKGLNKEENLIKFELLDAFDNPIYPFFNYQLKRFIVGGSESPIWMQSIIDDATITKFTQKRIELDKLNSIDS